MGNVSSEIKQAQPGVERKPMTTGSEPPTLTAWASCEKYRGRARNKESRRHAHDEDKDDSWQKIAAETGAQVEMITPRVFCQLRHAEPERAKQFAAANTSVIGLSTFGDRKAPSLIYNEKFLRNLKDQCNVDIVARKEEEDVVTFYTAKLGNIKTNENGSVVLASKNEGHDNQTTAKIAIESATSVEVEAATEKAPEGAAKAPAVDRLAVVSDIVVSYYDIPNLRRTLPNLKIHRFEALDDSIAVHRSMWSNSSTPMIRERILNNQFLSLVGDRELWDGPPLDAVHATVVVHACADDSSMWFSSSILTKLGAECASRMWKGCKRNGDGIWYEQGERLDSLPKESVVKTVVISSSAEPLSTVRLDSVPPEPYDEMELIKKCRSVAEVWPYLHLCGWVERSTAKIQVIRQDEEGSPLVFPGDEWKQPLPITVENFAKLIDQHGKDTSKLVVWDAKGSKYGDLHVEILNIWKKGTPAYENPEGLSRNERIFREGSESVVFYCNHSSTASPAAAGNYHAWLQEHHPEARQNVYMLDGGLGSFLSWAQKTDQVDKYFAYSGY